MAGYFVRRGEKIAGPVPTERLEELAASGRVIATDEIAQQAQGPWIPFARVKRLLLASEDSPVAAQPLSFEATSQPVDDSIAETIAETIAGRVSELATEAPHYGRPLTVPIRMMSQMRMALNERSQRRRERHVETLEAQASPTLQRQPWLVEVPAAATATLTMASAPTIDHIANLPAAPKRARQSRRVAILLALFLGAFGAHKMYLGQPWKGRFLIGCTVVGLLVTSLLALVDAVELWRTPRNTFDQRFGC